MASRVARIIKSDGVISIYAIELRSRGVLRGGKPGHDEMLAEACGFLLDLPTVDCEEPCRHARVALAKRSIFVERTDGWVVAALLVSSHKVGKSLPRVIRRLFVSAWPLDEAPDADEPALLEVSEEDDEPTVFSPGRRLTPRDDWDPSDASFS